MWKKQKFNDISIIFARSELWKNRRGYVQKKRQERLFTIINKKYTGTVENQFLELMFAVISLMV
jgi:hypothetical protein